MSATNGTQLTTTEYISRVVRLNERGLLFAGEASWRNISKFSGAITLPNVGDTVSVVLDKAGYIRSVSTVSGPVATGATATAPEPAARQNHAPAREVSIVRMNSLTNAVSFVTTCGGTLDDVLATAAAFEAWVLR